MQQQIDDLKADFNDLLAAINIAALSGTDDNGGGVLEEVMTLFNARHFARIRGKKQPAPSLEPQAKAIGEIKEALGFLSDAVWNDAARDRARECLVNALLVLGDD